MVGSSYFCCFLLARTPSEPEGSQPIAEVVEVPPNGVVIFWMFPWGFNQQNYRKCGVCYLFRDQFGLNHLFAIFRTGICIVNDWRVWIQFYSQKKDFTKIFGNHPEGPLGILDWMNYNILTTTTSPTSPWTLAIAEFCSSKSTMILVEQTPSPCGPLAIPLIHCKVAQTGPPGMILCVPMLLVVQKVRKYRNKSQCCFRWSMWCHIITCYSTHHEILDQFNAYLRTPSELGWLWAVRVILGACFGDCPLLRVLTLPVLRANCMVYRALSNGIWQALVGASLTALVLTVCVLCMNVQSMLAVMVIESSSNLPQSGWELVRPAFVVEFWSVWFFFFATGAFYSPPRFAPSASISWRRKCKGKRMQFPAQGAPWLVTIPAVGGWFSWWFSAQQEQRRCNSWGSMGISVRILVPPYSRDSNYLCDNVIMNYE